MYADLHSKIKQKLGSPAKEQVDVRDIPREEVVRQHLHALGELIVLGM